MSAPPPDQMEAHRVGSVTAYAPRATVGVDIDGDGEADYLVTGVDENRDGIPDSMQGRRTSSRMVREAESRREQEVDAIWRKYCDPNESKLFYQTGQYRLHTQEVLRLH